MPSVLAEVRVMLSRRRPLPVKTVAAKAPPKPGFWRSVWEDAQGVLRVAAKIVVVAAVMTVLLTLACLAVRWRFARAIVVAPIEVKQVGCKVDWQPDSDVLSQALRSKLLVLDSLWSDPYGVAELEREAQQALEAEYERGSDSQGPSAKADQAGGRPEGETRMSSLVQGEEALPSVEVAVPTVGKLDVSRVLDVLGHLAGCVHALKGTIVLGPRAVEGFFALIPPRPGDKTTSVHCSIGVIDRDYARATDRVLHLAANHVLLKWTRDDDLGCVGEGDVLAALSSLRLLYAGKLNRYECLSSDVGTDQDISALAGPVVDEIRAAAERHPTAWGGELARYHCAVALLTESVDSVSRALLRNPPPSSKSIQWDDCLPDACRLLVRSSHAAAWYVRALGLSWANPMSPPPQTASLLEAAAALPGFHAPRIELGLEALDACHDCLTSENPETPEAVASDARKALDYCRRVESRKRLTVNWPCCALSWGCWRRGWRDWPAAPGQVVREREPGNSRVSGRHRD